MEFFGKKKIGRVEMRGGGLGLRFHIPLVKPDVRS